MGDAGVSVVRGDGLAGEEGYEVFCAAADAEEVFDTLVTRGMNAPPFGYRTWETLTLEAGTPLFGPEIAGRLPTAVGLARLAPDAPAADRRLVGLRCDALPGAGATVRLDGEAVGTVTRAVESPDREEPIALALVESQERTLAVEAGAEAVAAERVALPFVEGSERSARLPTY
ncbi:MAG: glycine cleavage T C-terminal barrel domain-containing protein, partial [Haloarculaceae archaeon]